MIILLSLSAGFIWGTWFGIWYWDKRSSKLWQKRTDLITTQLADIEKKVKSSMLDVSKKSYLADMQDLKEANFFENVDQVYQIEKDR